MQAKEDSAAPLASTIAGPMKPAAIRQAFARDQEMKTLLEI
jgi:hypothetical protein